MDRLVAAAGPERARHAYRWLEGSEEHRAAQVDLFVEACSWHPDAPTFGGALSLAKALPLESRELPARKDELEQLVRAANPEQALLAFRGLSDEPELRQQQIADFVEICSWNPNLARFGGVGRVMRFLDACPSELRAAALAEVSRLDWGEDWFSYDAALEQVPPPGQLPPQLLEVQGLSERPTGEVGETEDHWLIAGTVLKKR